MAVQGLQMYSAATVYAAESRDSDSLEAGLLTVTLQDGSLVFVRSNNGTYRWSATSLEDPVDPRIVLPRGQDLDVAGRWLLITESTEAPGSSYVYQPGGLAGTGVVTDAADIGDMLAQATERGYGYSKFVLDGTFSDGLVSLSTGYDLLNFFDVELVNVKNVVLSLASQQSLFRNPRSRIQSNRPVLFTRLNSNEMHLVQMDNDSTVTSTALVMNNLVWDMTSFSTVDVGAMIMLMTGGNVRLEFDDCSLSPDLSIPRLEDKWIWVAGTAPDSLDVVWRGEFAAQLEEGNSQFMYTVLSGWDTVIYYGSKYGSLLTFSALSWAAGNITIVDIRP